MTNLECAGASAFGAVIGWVTYFTMRYNKEHAMSDIAVVVGAVGGAAVLKLFGSEPDLFAAYSIGLAVGFFVYVLIMLIATLSTEGAKGLADQSSKKNPFMGG
jgi:fucose permease